MKVDRLRCNNMYILHLNIYKNVLLNMPKNILLNMPKNVLLNMPIQPPI